MRPAASLWLQKLVLLSFIRHLIYHLRWERITIRSFLAVFAVSYVVVQVVTFSECRPLDLYWRVLPDPGSCSQAQVQLITLGRTPRFFMRAWLIILQEC
jgi:hypothetical protein